MSRGGCVVKTETSRIDARLESRINTIIANVLGDERAPERTDASEGSES
jgi:flagellar assembly protein FliH